MQTDKPGISDEVIVVGLGASGWQVLATGTSSCFFNVRVLFRKILRPKSPLDLTPYYRTVVVLRRWKIKEEAANIGVGGLRLYNSEVTEIIKRGEFVSRVNYEGEVFYVTSVLFDVGDYNLFS